MEQVPSDVGNHVQLSARAARALPVDGHLARVAAERSNMLLDKPQRLDLVVEPRIEVAQALVLEFGDGKEAEGVQTVVHRDDHDIGRLVDPVVERPVGRIAENVT